MNIQPTLIANGQPAEAVEPSKGAFHHPSVPSQLLLALNTSSGYARNYASHTQSFSVSFRVVTLICMHLVRTFTWPTSSTVQRRRGIYHLLQHSRVRYVSSCSLYDERYSSSAHHSMALRAWFSFIRRIWPCSFGFLAPFFTPLALTVCESMEALVQPICPASLRLSNRSLCSFFHTPAFCQSLMRRQQVMPEPQPISWGSSSHCKPVLSTNTMPVSTARAGIRGLPPFGLGGSGGKSGSITSHNSSCISGFAIPNFTRFSRFC